MTGADRASLTVFLVGLTALAYELLQVRMLAFFLGNNVDFLAIPIALLGLAIGSMFCHFGYRGDRNVLVSKLAIASLPLVLLVFLAFFVVADTLFSEIHVSLAHPHRDAARLVVYSALFLPPYGLFGAMLAALFAEGADRIGRLYFFDLAGAAVGCVATPLLLTWAGLPTALMAVLVFALGLVALHGRARTIAVGTAAVGITGVLAWAGVAFRAHPDPAVLARSVLGADRDVKEVRVRWNEIARTSVLRARGPGGVWHAIVQDNGLSNVSVTMWRPDLDVAGLKRLHHHRLPWAMGLDPANILVMFAGMGRDMVYFDRLAGGQAHIVGVEINADVVGAVDHPGLARYGLRAFHDQPQIELINLEGRNFLDVDRRHFDLIYVANNGAVHASRTGHTRKFLDTHEAMAAYLDHLADGGLILFMNQPVQEKIPSFKLLFAERQLGDPAGALYAFGRPRSPSLDTLLVKPGGFSTAELDALDAEVAQLQDGFQVLYSPRAPDLQNRIARRLTGPVNQAELVTDDRPFPHRLDLANFRLVPNAELLGRQDFVSSWIKVFTVLLFATVSAAAGLAAHRLGGAHTRVPAWWIAYFLATGVAYMCVEIGLIAKTELFIGNPLYAIAVNLALFLISNAAGAALHDRYAFVRRPGVLLVGTVAAVAWGIGAIELWNATLLSAALPLRILAVAIAVVPTGMALGAYYPYGVTRLVAAGRTAAVPMSYALTTLSSVLGSSFAMTAIIDLGFSTVIVLGTSGYLVACAIAWAGLRQSQARTQP